MRCKMHFLYKITNKVNGKIYIGQTNNLNRRWQAHKNAAIKNKPEQIIHHALIKYGLDNFEFDHLATCKTWENANEMETFLVKQENSLLPNGYNNTKGGFNAPKSEEFKQMMRDWHASLSPEEKERRAQIHRENIYKLFEEKGHPCVGRKWSEEEHLKQAEIRKSFDYEEIYNEEVRKRFSESHLGNKDSEETKQKKSESAKEAWETRIDYSRECQAPGCNISGKVKYKIINGVRYCNKHGLRMLRYGRLDTLAE